MLTGFLFLLFLKTHPSKQIKVSTTVLRYITKRGRSYVGRSIKSYCTFVFDIWTFKNYTGIIDCDLSKYIYRQMRSNLKWVKKLANIGKKNHQRYARLFCT